MLGFKSTAQGQFEGYWMIIKRHSLGICSVLSPLRLLLRAILCSLKVAPSGSCSLHTEQHIRRRCWTERSAAASRARWWYSVLHSFSQSLSQSLNADWILKLNGPYGLYITVFSLPTTQSAAQHKRRPPKHFSMFSCTTCQIQRLSTWSVASNLKKQT